MQVQTSLIAAFKACRKLSCKSSGSSSLQLELALLTLLQALKTFAAEQGLPADKVAAMAVKLSKAAAELLQETWQGPEDEAAEADAGVSRLCDHGSNPVTVLCDYLVWTSMFNISTCPAHRLCCGELQPCGILSLTARLSI